MPLEFFEGFDWSKVINVSKVIKVNFTSGKKNSTLIKKKLKTEVV